MAQPDDHDKRQFMLQRILIIGGTSILLTACAGFNHRLSGSEDATEIIDMSGAERLTSQPSSLKDRASLIGGTHGLFPLSE
jgi:hypothetical protein